MENCARYTWTISVLAMLDRNDLLMWEAYSEFEESITTLKNATKDIQFVIYLYDVKDKKAYIKKSVVLGKRYKFKIESVEDVPDFYKKGYPHLVGFFKNYVSKNSVDNEEHKHLFIIWGHAAGLGFMKQEIEQKLKKVLDEIGMLKLISNQDINLLVEDMSSYNFLKSQLSVDSGEFEGEFLEHLAKKFQIHKEAFEIDKLKKEVSKIISVVSANELAEVLQLGLAEDKSVVSVVKDCDDANFSSKRIHVMLCLACYVNMAETGFALKNIVHTYIAPRTGISFFGYNYKELFKLLVQRPNASEREIVVNITDYYLVKYAHAYIGAEPITNDFEIGGINYKYGVSFAGVYLCRYAEIAQIIGKFSKLITAINSDDVISILKKARARCLTVIQAGRPGLGIIDYHNFLTEFFRLWLDTGAILETEPSDFYFDAQLISDYYPGNLADSTFTTFDKDYVSQSPGSFSIFLPINKPTDIEKRLLEIYAATKQPGSFLDISKWSDIVSLLLLE